MPPGAAWGLLTVASLLLIGGLCSLWRWVRTGTLGPGAWCASSCGLYLLNQGLVVPLTAGLLFMLGGWVRPDRLGVAWRPHELALAFLLFEMTTYALHRTIHRVPTLMRLHRTHHDHRDLDWLVAFRQHPIEFFLFHALGNLPGVLLFGPEAHVSLWINVGLRFWTAWLHDRGSIDLGRLSYVFTSPAMHAQHHAPCARDLSGCNYGGVLSLFDWLGRTART